MIIAVEGIDGAGKNTLATELVSLTQGHRLGFPRYEQHIEAQLAQQALYGQLGDLIDSVHGMAVLFALDRYRAKDEIATFASGGTYHDSLLVLDRYCASNAAYSMARTGDPKLAEFIYDLEFGRLGLPQPDLHVLVAPPAAVAAHRAHMREQDSADRRRDLYEKNTQLQLDTHAAYQQLADSNWVSPWIRFDTSTTTPITVIAEDILRHIGR